MKKKIRKWSERNLSYTLHKPSKRTFKCNKVYAPEIDSLLETDSPFVRDVAKNMMEGVIYLRLFMYFQNM